MKPSDVIYGLTEDHLIDLSADGLTNIKVHAAIREDLLKLRDAMLTDGIQLAIASSFRSFERQKLIWQAKFAGLRPVLDSAGQPMNVNALTAEERMWAILRWSALPGASRHHWGTDLDIYDSAAVDSNYVLQLSAHEYASDGPFATLSAWLQQHSKQYGFFRPYAMDRGGVAQEDWHISHHQTATQLAQQFELDAWLALLQQESISGIDSITKNINVIYQKFITNINNA